MPLRRAPLLVALAACAILYGASRIALRIEPAHEDVPVSIEGTFPRDGQYPGEAFETDQPVRMWASWAGSDENIGTLMLGPFPAPQHLRFGVGGYPAEDGIELYVEHDVTKQRTPVRTPNVGERWHIADCQLPADWQGQPVNLIARDNTKALGGWLGITEPIRGGRGDGAAAVLETFAAFLLNGFLFGAVWLASARWLSTRGWVAGHWIPLAAAAIVAAVGYLLFWCYFAHPTLGKCASVAALLFAAWKLWRTRNLTLDALSDTFAVTRPLLVIGVFYLALLHLFPSPLDFYTLAANRFRDGLPADNMLPHAVGARLFFGEPLKRPDDDWLSSDRPPLQSGWQMLTWPVLAALKIDARAGSGTASVWLQLTWTLAAFGLLRALGLSSRTTCAWIAVLALSGFFLQNTTFTWPKLSAAAFACGAFGLWVFPARGTRDRTSVGIGAGFAALAWLSHGGVAFAFVALLPWIAWRCLRGEWRQWILAGLVFAALTGPWFAYQKFYDPPGNRLLKWHLGGQMEKDPRGAWQTIREEHARLTPNEIWQNKRENFRMLNLGDWKQVASVARDTAGMRRDYEFFSFLRALAWWQFAIVLLPLVLIRGLKGRLAAPLRRHVALLLWPLTTVVVWCLLMFIGGSTVIHQGSYTVPLAAFVILSAWFTLAGRTLRVVIAVLQSLSLFTTWTISNPVVYGAPSWAMLTVAVLAGAGLGMLILRCNDPETAKRPERNAADARPDEDGTDKHSSASTGS